MISYSYEDVLVLEGRRRQELRDAATQFRRQRESNSRRRYRSIPTITTPKEIPMDNDELPPEQTYVKEVPYVIAERTSSRQFVCRFYNDDLKEFVDRINHGTQYSFEEVMSMCMPENGMPYPVYTLAEYCDRVNERRERSRRYDEAVQKHFRQMYNRDIFEWQWEPTGPSHEGVYVCGGNDPLEPDDDWTFKVRLCVPTHEDDAAGWYYYIGPWPKFKPCEVTAAGTPRHKEEVRDEPVPEA